MYPSESRSCSAPRWLVIILEKVGMMQTQWHHYLDSSIYTYSPCNTLTADQSFHLLFWSLVSQMHTFHKHSSRPWDENHPPPPTGSSNPVTARITIDTSLIGSLIGSHHVIPVGMCPDLCGSSDPLVPSCRPPVFICHGLRLACCLGSHKNVITTVYQPLIVR